MKSKRILGFVLAAAMLFSLALCGSGAAFADEPDVDAQLSLIFSKIDQLFQPNTGLTWYYTVTDLDHNGRLEFVAATQHPQDRSTNLKIWEVSADLTSLTDCTVSKDEDESFPDILTDSADTYHDAASNSWFYLFYDNVVLSESEVYTSKSAYRLKDGNIAYLAYAIEHTVVENGTRTVTHMDPGGNPIAPDQYNAAGANAFSGMDRSSTNFDWFTAADATALSRLADSYAVFTGRKNAPQYFPVPKPAALEAPAATAAPIPTAPPAPAASNVYLSVTKNPTNENRTAGNTALFVSCANVFDYLTWTMVSPNGGEYSTQNFASMFPAVSVTGQSSTTLSIANTTTDVNGWGAYCTFYYQGQTARTSTAYMYISAKQSGVAPSGTYSGSVTDWSYNSVTLKVQTVTVSVPWGLCDVDGDLYYGAPASVVWDGQNVTYCYISGSHSSQPTYGSMSGTIYGDGAYSVYIVLQNGQGVHVSNAVYNWVTGSYMEGASCTVYYVGSPTADNIYQVDIYGWATDPSAGGGWAGSSYYEDPWTYYDDYSLYDDFPIYSDALDYAIDSFIAESIMSGDLKYCFNCDELVYDVNGYCPYCGSPIF